MLASVESRANDFDGEALGVAMKAAGIKGYVIKTSELARLSANRGRTTGASHGQSSCLAGEMTTTPKTVSHRPRASGAKTALT